MTNDQQSQEENRCHLCLQNKPLSFEHVPPRSANNNQKVFLFDLQNWLQRSEGGEVRGRQYQRGAGVQTLCRDCNSMAGKWYVHDYAEMVRVGIGALRQIPEDKLRMADEQVGVSIHGCLTVQGARPLRLLKQIITMMLAISTVGYCVKHPALREFVLDPHKTGLPPAYRFGLSFYMGTIARYAPHVGILSTTTGKFMFVSELALPPFSMMLGMNGEPPSEGHADITHFADSSVDQAMDMPLAMDVRFGHTPYALDFQTKVEKEAQQQRLHLKK